jgi:hypothetical protein
MTDEINKQKSARQIWKLAQIPALAKEAPGLKETKAFFLNDNWMHEAKYGALLYI